MAFMTVYSNLTAGFNFTVFFSSSKNSESEANK